MPGDGVQHDFILFYVLCILRKVQHILQRLCFFICTCSILFDNLVELVLFEIIYFFTLTTIYLAMLRRMMIFILFRILFCYFLFNFSFIYFLTKTRIYLAMASTTLSFFIWFLIWLYFILILICLFICFLTLTTISLAMVSSTFFVCFVYLVIFLYLFGSSIYWFDNWLPYRDDHLFGDGVQHDDVIWYLILFDKFYFSIIYLFAFSDDPSLQRRRDGVWHGDFISFCYFILFCFAFFYFQFIIDSFPHRNDHLYDDGVQQHGLISDMHLFYFSFLISYYLFSYYVVCI